ncbi:MULTISPECIES: alpha/beta fold hydrolase [unclassified Moraxella]|uniref:alpha/beta fold hydrolase n=1 Tax=unclassified Moraxella TaxID=2685852 RepID=UPI003AF81BBB
MSIYQLKRQFQNQLRPISDQLVQQGVTANQVTVSAVVLSGATAYVIAYQADKNPALWYALPISLFVQMAMNAIDGMMAKEHGQASTLGAWLNEVGDIVSDRMLIGSLSSHLTQYQLSQYSQDLARVQALTFATELVAIGSQQLVNQRANQGPLGKSDRALELGVIGVLSGSGFSLLPYARYLFLANQLLLIKTIANRLQFIASQYWQQQYLEQKQRLLTENPIEKSMTVNQLTIKETISCFNSYDGTAIFYRYWLGKSLDDIQANASDEKIVILLHRGHEHSGRLIELAHAFVQAGYQVFAWDARGNGRSGGERDDAENFGQLVRDLDEFIHIVKAQTHTTTEQLLVVASSLGAVIASSWVHDYAPTVRGMILGTPAFAIRLYVPFALPALKVAKKIGLMSKVSSYVKAKVLTHDDVAGQAYNDDPLISSSISRDLLIDSLQTGKRLVDDAGAIVTPTFILCAGKDYVVDKQVIRDFYETIRSPIKRWAYYPDSYHAIFHEVNKQQVFAECIDFANDVFAKPLSQVDLQNADKPKSQADSYSKDRVDRLAVKGFNPQFALTKLAIHKFGHISDGVATGIKHGFDSGSSLEKVYQNQPQGKNLFGKVVDKFYLNNIGWRGIRIRKQHLLELGQLALDNLNHLDKTGNDATIKTTIKATIKAVDIASGNGYYMFELAKANPTLNAELRDYDSHNIEVMSQKAQELGFNDRVKAVQKDAFEAKSYTDKAQYQLAVASGVFELFTDNDKVKTAIQGIYQQLSEGGYFIYTNQPWHPEQEFIGKTLNSHQGKDWVMRCRSQAEIDQLVTNAGFEKVTMRIDEFGIFTVSLAVKKPLAVKK